MEWLEAIRPWIVPVIAIIGIVLAFTGKLYSLLFGPFKASIKELRGDIENIHAEIKEFRTEIKSDHDKLEAAFTKHLIELHGRPEGVD